MMLPTKSQRKLFLIVVLFLLQIQTGVFSQTLTSTIYSTAGTFDWVVPTCVTSITVRAWGGGGAGGGASSTDRNGGGGGGGAYCFKSETVTPGETIRITVGAGGTGVSGGTGNPGGFSQVQHLTGSVVFCKAVGGAGGQKGSSSSSAGAGGTGGQITNNIPANVGYSGGNGGSSNANTLSFDQSGGGGGGAGSGSSGGNGGTPTAGLAGSPGGGAGGAGVQTTTTAGSNGNPGTALGGGGGGATTYTGTTTGGSGAKGQVTITYVATGCQPAQSLFAYSTPGTYSWVVPACVNFVTVEAWGGGGGGGGNIAVLSTSGGETCTGAGGGGGGGYAARTYAVTPGQTYTIVVGAGGAAGAAGVGTTASITTPAGTGGTGQSSTFSGPATVASGTLTAAGGAGGAGAGGRNTSSSACLPVSGLAGAGGAGTNGSINYTGGSGASGYILDHSTDKSGGGGGAAGPGGNGGSATAPANVGITAPPGGIGDPPSGNGGAGKMWNLPGLNQQNGDSGGAMGGGGGGSLIHTGTVGAYTATGGAGGRGEVRLSYNTACPLPIELVSFEGTCTDTNKLFSWITASEFNNQYFTIEHSVDGENFSSAKIIQGAGTTSETQYYSSRLTESDEAYSYYRLRQTDIDGMSDLSEILYLSCRNQITQELSVFPNPSESIINIQMEDKFTNRDLLISVQDINGRTLIEKEKSASDGSGIYTLSIEQLLTGIYTVVIKDQEGVVSSKRIVKL